MQVIAKCRLNVWLLGAALLALAVALIFGGCGDDESTPDSTAAVTTAFTVADGSTASMDTTTNAPSSSSSTSASSATTAAGSGDTTTTLPSTTTTVATTTTAGPTSTTAKPTTTTAKPTTTTAPPTTTTAKGPTVLTVQGPSGTKELSMAELKAMSASAGYGGWLNQLGNITPPTSWKGVSLRSLMELAGGGGSVTIVASDGYSASLSADQAAGAVTTYDPATGEVIGGIKVRAIVAYAKGGGSLSSGEGPLRLAFVSSEKNQVTDSDMWVKMVVEIRVN